MNRDKETEEKKLRDLTPLKDAKGGARKKQFTYPPSKLPGARPKLAQD